MVRDSWEAEVEDEVDCCGGGWYELQVSELKKCRCRCCVPVTVPVSTTSWTRRTTMLCVAGTRVSRCSSWQTVSFYP